MSTKLTDSTHQRWRYDVFLSFRGEDTRWTFTGHLYYALKDSGVNVFMDEAELPRGEDISSGLVEAIRSSRISVIVFSGSYAGSRWCLQELVEIMESRKSLGQVVLPVFYDINPSDVRKQSGSFEHAFDEYDSKVVSNARAALTEAGALSGWDLTNMANRKEAKIVRQIVRRIWNELENPHLDVAKYPVGLNTRLAHIKRVLHLGSSNVIFVGISGIGGIGKTTLAKAVYNELFHSFEAKSFIANVRENSEQHNGLVLLQEQLLRDITMVRKINLGNVHRGANVIKERLCSRRVLIVIDDLTDTEQLAALAREREWFGSGSRIIITTRNEDLLKEVEVDYLHILKEMNDDESLQLFSWHAFRNSRPEKEYTDLSMSIVKYCKGLPLALVVLGSFLLELSVVEWRNALDRLKRSPPNRIQSQLQISFDALGDDEKDIFLDIACFFVGEDVGYVVKVLNSCGLSAEIGLSILTKRSLVRTIYVREQGNVMVKRIEMHDLIQDMGREIVRKESPKDPGKRSRLWSQSDVLMSLQNHLGTHHIEGLALNLQNSPEVMLSTEALGKMRRLRLLLLDNVHLQGDYGLLSNELRWLRWHKFPLNFIPDGFYMGNMVAIDMQYSKLRAAWKATKFLGNLKILNLSHSHLLTRTPDFSKLANLEELILENCSELKDIDQSILHLQRLVELNVRDCKKLRSIPSGICRLNSLRKLDISGCSNIDRLPEDVGGMYSLSVLLADKTAITQLPPSIISSKNLKVLSLHGCKRSTSGSVTRLIWSWILARQVPKDSNQLTTSLYGLTSLTMLSLRDCKLSDDDIPAAFGNLQSLKVLDLGKNDFHHIPAAIRCLSKLEIIDFGCCTELECISNMPPSLEFIGADYCASLERVSLSACKKVRISLENCPKLEHIFGLDGRSIGFDRFRIMSTKLRDYLMKDWEGVNFATTLENDISDQYFEHESDGPWLASLLPPCSDCKLQLSMRGTMAIPNPDTFQDMGCLLSVFLARKAKTMYQGNYYLYQVFPNPPLPPQGYSFNFHYDSLDMVGNSDNKYINFQLDPNRFGHCTTKGFRFRVKIKFCSRCQLSHWGDTVGSSGPEMIPVDHPGASATCTAQSRANTKRRVDHTPMWLEQVQVKTALPSRARKIKKMRYGIIPAARELMG